MHWWGILSVGAQSAAIDCTLAPDSPVTLQGQDPRFATVFQRADLARLRCFSPFSSDECSALSIDANAIFWNRDICFLSGFFPFFL